MFSLPVQQLFFFLVVAFCGSASAGASTANVKWFDLGAYVSGCGQNYTSNDHVIALPGNFLDSQTNGKSQDPNENALCDKLWRVTYRSISIITQAIPVQCATCQGDELGISPRTYKELAPVQNAEITFSVQYQMLTAGTVEDRQGDCDALGAPPIMSPDQPGTPQNGTKGANNDENVKRSIYRRGVLLPVTVPRRSTSDGDDGSIKHKFAARGEVKPQGPKLRLERRRVTRPPITAR